MYMEIDMPRTNKTRYAVLGMLTIAPMSGYDIRKEMQTNTGYFWSESDGQLYPMLEKLTEEGMITFRAEESVGKRKRKIYCITCQGLVDLRTWLSKPSQTKTVRNEMLLKLFFGENVPAEISINTIAEYRADLTNRLIQYKKIIRKIKKESQNTKEFDYWSLTLNYGLRLSQAALKWCDESASLLKKRPK